MASPEQDQSQVTDGDLAYILQPIREYDKDNHLLQVVKRLSNDTLDAQFAGEVLKRAIEIRQRIDGQ